MAAEPVHFPSPLQFPRLQAVPKQEISPASVPTVLVLDEEGLNRRLLKAILKESSYRILEASHPTEALSFLENEPVDLVVLDLLMPDMSGPEFCQLVKANRRTALIPLLIITSMPGVENEIAGIASGADEFLVRPLHPDVVRARVKSMLRTKLATDSLEEAETILFALARAVERRDQYTGDHCDRLAHYSVALGMALGLGMDQLWSLHQGGYLHDIGKVSVPDAILFKNGPLSPPEWRTMQHHPITGEEICRPMKSLASVLPLIRSHHERWDGTGYPDGLEGGETPLLARILQIADIYDALTTVRPYKPALSHAEALSVLNLEKQKGWRDPELVAAFTGVCLLVQPDLGEPLYWPEVAEQQRQLEARRHQWIRMR